MKKLSRDAIQRMVKSRGNTIYVGGGSSGGGGGGGGTGDGTVTSVGMTVPTGFSVSGSPVTTSGTLAVSFATGYTLPTTAKQTNWDTAYSWGNHAQAGYATQTWVGQQGYITQTFADNRYLQLSGGTMTGSLAIGDSNSSLSLRLNGAAVATQNWVSNQGFATESYVDNELGAYALETWVQAGFTLSGTAAEPAYIDFPAESGVRFDIDSAIYAGDSEVTGDQYLHINGYEEVVVGINDGSSTSEVATFDQYGLKVNGVSVKQSTYVGEMVQQLNFLLGVKSAVVFDENTGKYVYLFIKKRANSVYYLKGEVTVGGSTLTNPLFEINDVDGKVTIVSDQNGIYVLCYNEVTGVVYASNVAVPPIASDLNDLLEDALSAYGLSYAAGSLSVLYDPTAVVLSGYALKDVSVN